MGKYLEDYPHIGAALQQGMKLKVANVQGDHPITAWSTDSVDLTSSTAVPITRKSDQLDHSDGAGAKTGYGSCVVTRVYYRITTKLDFSNSPEITIQDAGGNSSKIKLTDSEFSTGDSTTNVAANIVGEDSEATAVATLDLSSDSLVAKTTTLASQSSGTAGAGVVYVEAVPKPL